MLRNHLFTHISFVYSSILVNNDNDKHCKKKNLSLSEIVSGLFVKLSRKTNDHRLFFFSERNSVALSACLWLNNNRTVYLHVLSYRSVSVIIEKWRFYSRPIRPFHPFKLLMLNRFFNPSSFTCLFITAFTILIYVFELIWFSSAATSLWPSRL